MPLIGLCCAAAQQPAIETTNRKRFLVRKGQRVAFLGSSRLKRPVEGRMAADRSRQCLLACVDDLQRHVEAGFIEDQPERDRVERARRFAVFSRRSACPTSHSSLLNSSTSASSSIWYHHPAQWRSTKASAHLMPGPLEWLGELGLSQAAPSVDCAFMAHRFPHLRREGDAFRAAEPRWGGDCKGALTAPWQPRPPTSSAPIRCGR